MNDQTTSLPYDNETTLDEDAIGAGIEIDWEEIGAAVDPDDPLGRPAFNSEDYETDEEEDAAYEAFVMRIIGDSDEDT